MTLFSFVGILAMIPLYGMFHTCHVIHDWFLAHKKLEADLEKLHVGNVHLGGLSISVFIASVSLFFMTSPWLVIGFPKLQTIAIVTTVFYTFVTLWKIVQLWNNNVGARNNTTSTTTPPVDKKS